LEPDWTGELPMAFYFGDKVLWQVHKGNFYLLCFMLIKKQNEVIDIDMKRTENVRRIWPFLRDRRIDAYGDILKRYID
jgi:hypothetical protein